MVELSNGKVDTEARPWRHTAQAVRAALQSSDSWEITLLDFLHRLNPCGTEVPRNISSASAVARLFLVAALGCMLGLGSKTVQKAGPEAGLRSSFGGWSLWTWIPEYCSIFFKHVWRWLLKTLRRTFQWRLSYFSVESWISVVFGVGVGGAFQRSVECAFAGVVRVAGNRMTTGFHSALCRRIWRCLAGSREEPLMVLSCPFSFSW